MLNKLFSSDKLTDYNKLQYDTEGLYSITNFKEADIISKIIKNNFLSQTQNNLRILDGNGGIGGNTISFGKNFKKVTSIEINNDRYKMLKNNISQYNLTNVSVLNNNSIDYVLANKDLFDVYFFDPPWGGPDYKYKTNLTFKFDGNTLSDIAYNLKNNQTNKLLIYKLPFNYNFDEFNCFDYKLYKINKYYIIVILI